jgi:uncharacterized protein with HEPN domain
VSRSDADRVRDIRVAIDRCIAYRAHLQSPEIGQMAYDAELRNLAVIGEAVKALPSTFKEDRAHVPCAAIAGLRNVLVHEYFRVSRALVIDLIDNTLMALRDAIGDE